MRRIRVRPISHAIMLHGLQPGYRRSPDKGPHGFDPFAEGTGRLRQFEHHVAHLAPLLVHGLLFAHDAGEAVEVATTEPEFPIQGPGWKPGGEPGGRVDRLAATEPQGLAVPECPGAIQLLADPIQRNIGLVLEDVGEQQGRGRRMLIGEGGPRQPNQQQEADENEAPGASDHGPPTGGIRPEKPRWTGSGRPGRRRWRR
jgi:hypothetical protein